MARTETRLAVYSVADHCRLCGSADTRVVGIVDRMVAVVCGVCFGWFLV